MPRRRLAAVLFAAVSSAGHADEPLKNWFDDPYFQVRDRIAGCAVPRGPMIGAAEMRKEAHARVERGTSCWLEGRCTRPNAYQYDATIAEAVRARFAGSSSLANASLWVTVQRRIVWVEGCAAAVDAPRQVGRLLHGVPDVHQVIVNVARRPGDRPPYTVLDAVAAGAGR